MDAAAKIRRDIVQRLLAGRPAASARPTELRLSDLEKVSYLGMGGFGAVFKVRHRETGRVYALKTALHADDTAVVEARALSIAAGSPHVVHLYSVLPGSSGELGLVLELMDAGSLHSVLRRRRGRGFPEPAIAEVAAQCLLGLAHLHSLGIAHLDLKPDNLLASSRSDIKIGDFGLSQMLCAPNHSVKITAGTAAYMSPERFVHGARACMTGAFAADVWSLGVTLLELYLGGLNELPSGEVPTLADLIRYPRDAELPTKGFLMFLEACLQWDPARRSTVKELITQPFIAFRDGERSSRSLREVIVDSMQA